MMQTWLLDEDRWVSSEEGGMALLFGDYPERTFVGLWLGLGIKEQFIPADQIRLGETLIVSGWPDIGAVADSLAKDQHSYAELPCWTDSLTEEDEANARAWLRKGITLHVKGLGCGEEESKARQGSS